MKPKAERRDFVDVQAIKQALLTLNYRLTRRALNLWEGKDPQFSYNGLYHDMYDLLNPTAIRQIGSAPMSTKERQRVFHAALGHYLQHRLFPYENELFTLIKGAAVHVDGEKIYLKDILSWCQKQSNVEQRRAVEKEASSLSKFLEPFALGFWEYLIELLRDEFDYGNYVAYCEDKKQINYDSHVSKLKGMLEDTDTLYFEAMQAWVKMTFGVSLSELNRYDAIYILGLTEFDRLFPSGVPLDRHLDFFRHWGIQVKKVPGVYLHIDHSPQKSSQAMSFALRIPDEIHLVMNPQGGWIDLETLFHEMGHALSHAFTSRDLSSAEKDFFTSNTLSETYAFLLQNMCMSPVFLERHLGLSSEATQRIAFYKALKDLSVFRRYASKFLAEYEMFDTNNIANGDAYAGLLRKHTGFSYRPESHLFDLVPEFYALDYVISWMAEATMEKTLVESLGHDWMFKPETGRILKDWWQCGNRYELDEFFAVKGIGPIDEADIVNRWYRTCVKE